MTFNPLAGNPLQTRDHVANAVRALFEPLTKCFSPGRARVRIIAGGAHYDDMSAELEGFTRPLWGIAPLVAGGGAFQHWDLIHEGIANGTDPLHPEFWGTANSYDQRLVEMAALGFALALIPERIWDPLPRSVRSNLVQWLGTINTIQCHNNNWQFFRVLVNLGLKRIGGPYVPDKIEAACKRIDGYYVGDGWYRDGARPQFDHYVAFTFHFYGLIYARLQTGGDPARAAVYRERAALFAQQYRHWFAPDGGALAFGRSLTYRFAVAGFWGALAFADVKALPWSEVKGLYLRQLRWWSHYPIADHGGNLSVGYGYPNLLISEEYNSPQSPYWAMKAFLPLAVPAAHAFWNDDEASLPISPPAVQPHPGMIILHSATHAVALSSGQSAPRLRQGAAKYAKFAYSSRFGFSVESDWGGVDRGVYDNMLAIAHSDDPHQFRVRETVEAVSISTDFIYSRWRPWHDVEIETWLVPIELPWLLRIHLIRNAREVLTKEGGFAIDRTDSMREPLAQPRSHSASAIMRVQAGASGIMDLAGGRRALLVAALPNTNVIYAHTAVPMLYGRYRAGFHLLATGVFATAEPGAERFWGKPPSIPDGPWSKSRI